VPTGLLRFSFYQQEESLAKLGRMGEMPPESFMVGICLIGVIVCPGIFRCCDLSTLDLDWESATLLHSILI
jgi:hypothetical protein